MNTAVAGASAAPRSFKDVWLISAGHAFTHWYTATFYLLLPLIGKELGLSYTEIGLIMAIQNGVGRCRTYRAAWSWTWSGRRAT